ncbi:MAG: hypothetical protein C4523_09910 [Myxococcales bacterium]|nr:MAG: hypothetical protein C4523_09910 [Myxococcales bacterium]
MTTPELATSIGEALVTAPEIAFALPPETPEASVDPLFRLLGAPLIVRTLRQLQDAGVQNSVVVLPERWRAAEAAVKSDFRITHRTTFHFYGGTLPAETALMRAAAALSGPAFICRSDWVSPAAYLKALAAKPLEVEARLAIAPTSSRWEAAETYQEDERWRVRLPKGVRRPFEGAGLISKGLLTRLQESGGRLIDALDQAAQAGGVEWTTVDSSWGLAVGRRADIADAEKRLLNALRKPIDGVISRTINRNISIPISRYLANTPVTPNMASASTLLFAFVAVWMVTHGGYWWMLLGAALFQFASIVDGVDGELARLKYQFSKYGEWIDTVIDDISNFSFFAALTYAIFQGRAEPGWLWVLGVLTLACYAVITPLMYSYIILYTKSGDVMAIDYEFNKSDSLQDNRFVVRFMAALKYVAKRDFFIFMIFVFALFGKLPYMLIPAGLGAAIILSTVAKQHLRKRRETTG